SYLGNPVVWVVYGAIFVYYIAATLFPIDKIIGKIYPIFGAILLLSAVGVGFGLFFKGYQLDNLSMSNWMGTHPQGIPILPIFFVTVACGIVSGFHSTQATLIARSVTSERQGRGIFYNSMILEGLIAMIWAAAAMGMYNKGIDNSLVGTISVVGLVARDLLGNFGGIIAVLGIIVLPITSGDTALRSMRLILAEYFHLDQTVKKNRLSISIAIFVAVAAILLFAKSNDAGFNVLWRYFAWSNQTVATFAFAMISVYLIEKNKNCLISLLPGMFYAFIVTTYIVNAKIGFNLSYNISYIIGCIGSLAYCTAIIKYGNARKKSLQINSNL
ncbi:MAG: carbon starvation protein A, partial [Clostridioides sp.]|nr:carbon starvation protein A [Clostridioides sp.]